MSFEDEQDIVKFTPDIEKVHVIIGYDKTENGGYKIAFSEAIWPKFQELVSKGADSLGFKVVLEDNANPTTTI